MQILITGGGGFLGEHVIKELLKRPHYLLTNFSRNNYSHLEDIGVPTIKGDLREKDQIENAFRKGNFKAIIHLAALNSDWGRDEDIFQTNYLGTKNLIEVARKFSVLNLLFVSPAHKFLTTEDFFNTKEDVTYPKVFLNSYFESKALAEKYVLDANHDFFATCSLRLPPLWGPGDLRFLPPLIQKAREGDLKVIGDGENLSDLLFVENAAVMIVKAFEKLLEGQIKGEAFFLSEGKPMKLWDMLLRVLAFYNIDPPHQSLNFSSALRSARILEKIYKWAGIIRPKPPLTKYSVTRLGRSHYFSPDKFNQYVGKAEVLDFEHALKKTFSLRGKMNSNTRDLN